MKTYINNLLILLLFLIIVVISIIFGFKSNRENFAQSNEIHVFYFYTDHCNTCDYFNNNIWNKMIKKSQYTDIYFYKRHLNDNINDNLNNNSNITYKSKYNLIQSNKYSIPIIMLVFNNNNYFYDYKNRTVSESNIIKWISSITNRIATPINWKEINTPY